MGEHWTKCLECGYKKARHDDPRDPPLQLGEALCDECAAGVYEEERDNAQEALDDVLADIERRKKRWGTTPLWTCA